MASTDVHPFVELLLEQGAGGLPALRSVRGVVYALRGLARSLSEARILLFMADMSTPLR